MRVRIAIFGSVLSLLGTTVLAQAVSAPPVGAAPAGTAPTTAALTTVPPSTTPSAATAAGASPPPTAPAEDHATDSVAAIVNDAPITAYELRQRILLFIATSGLQPTA